ncbi:hypothetical protein HY469_01615 [Candidatus Roizmanbacteria bacterium]|nr:hypothetical protein [Candidatus Roizmanbacteria bacterium]
MRKLLIFLVALFVGCAGLYLFSKDALPSSHLFYAKRMSENIILATKTNPEQRAQYYSELLDIRLKEMQELYDRKEFDLMLSASLRYSTTAGRLTETLKTNQLNTMNAQIKEQFTSHKQSLQSMADTYMKEEEGDRWRFIIDAKNYLEIYEKELP